MRKLEGRSALVTGGAGGMGRAGALALAGEGARVVVADIAVEGGEQTAAMIREAGGEAEFIEADVSSATAVTALVDHAVDVHGGLDCALNAAAIEFEDVDVTRAEEADYDRMMDVNVRSVFLCLQYELRAMMAAGTGGSIVTIASTSGTRPQFHSPLYTASKHAVLGLVKATALDFARKGIRINAISPGPIDTPMLQTSFQRRGLDPEQMKPVLSPMKRFGRPEEVAAAVVWLCSDDSSFVTGHSLVVDGGMLVG